MTYRVERTYQNFFTGEHRTEVLPKRYKTYLGAEKCARRCSWATVPAHGVRIDSSNAWVVSDPESKGGE
jgi:hypothetical protein